MKNSQRKRYKPTAKQRGAVSKETYAEVMERDNYQCQRCGAFAGQPDKHGFPLRLELAHLINRSQGGTGQADNLIVLCGPSVNSGTCHHWADGTREGREWRKEQRERLKQLHANNERG